MVATVTFTYNQKGKTMIELSRDLRDMDLPTPNVYLATVSHQGKTYSTFIAADYSLAAIRKVQRWCVDNHLFRPTRGNSDTKLRRFKLGDYLETPEGLQQAMINAQEAHERDTVLALGKRHQQVNDILTELQGTSQCDFASLEAQLTEALRSAA